MRLSSREYHISLLILALLGFSIVLVTTSKYGAGVSSDAVRAMSTAEELLAGRGFVDFTGAPYVLWPPLYPLLLAGLSWLTSLDVFHTAWYLNLVLFPVNIWLWGRLFERIFPGKLIFGLLASAITLISSSMIRIYANVASDPLFVTLMVLFFLAAADAQESRSDQSLWAMFILAGLAMVQRYLGVVLFGVAGLVVLSRDGLRGIPRMILPAGLSLLPLAAWLLLHNYLGYRTLFGTRLYDQMWPLENISLSLTKILHWFLPYAPGLKPLLLRPWTILLPLLFLLLLFGLINRGWMRAWWQALSGPSVWPALCFGVVYYFLLAFTVNTIDHRDLTSDRYYVILLPVLMIFVLLTWEKFGSPLVNPSRLLRVIASAALALWFLYPLFDLQEYLVLSLENGEPSNYNIYNSRHFTELEVVRIGRELVEEHPQAILYSNYVNLLWFQYKRPILVLPQVGNNLSQSERLAILREEYPDWPGKKGGFIIWFTPNEYKHLASPEELGQIARLKLIYQDDDGAIYQLHPR